MRGVQRTIREQTGDTLGQIIVVGMKAADRNDIPIGINGQPLNNAVKTVDHIKGCIQLAVQIDPGNVIYGRLTIVIIFCECATNDRLAVGGLDHHCIYLAVGARILIIGHWAGNWIVFRIVGRVHRPG